MTGLPPDSPTVKTGLPPNGVSNPYALVGDETNPILKPGAAEVVKRHGDISRQGLTYPTPSNQCWPGGVPFVFWNLCSATNKMRVLTQIDALHRYSWKTLNGSRLRRGDVWDTGVWHNYPQRTEPTGNSTSHENRVEDVQFLDVPGGRLVSRSCDWTVRLWDAMSGEPVGKPMPHEDEVRGVK